MDNKITFGGKNFDLVAMNFTRLQKALAAFEESKKKDIIDRIPLQAEIVYHGLSQVDSAIERAFVTDNLTMENVGGIVEKILEVSGIKLVPISGASSGEQGPVTT